jgi:zinc and cadmium transporter
VILTLVALAAGTLLGDALLHLLPEAAEVWEGMTPTVGLLVLAGFMVFFVLESVLRSGHAHGEMVQEDHGHPGHSHEHPRKAAKIAPFAWMNLIGDGLHNLLDGMLLAAAFTVDMALGIATTIAVVLHEIPQELGDFAVLVRAGMRPSRALLWNFLSALAAVAGAALFLVLPFPLETLHRFALPAIAGGFIYIAAADLVPELHHHTGDRHIGAIMAGFIAGLGVMGALLLLE